MTTNGGSGDGGVIFSFDPASSIYAKLKDLVAPDGIHPAGSLIQASDGKLYGMTSNYGQFNGAGVIFSFNPSSSIYTKLMDFNGTNGSNPLGSLIQASNGKLYGITSRGGSEFDGISHFGLGVIFSFDPSTSYLYKAEGFRLYQRL
ncbi:hypothetical protein BH10BAC3_BH10BAC3_17470 [soil metagenome]